jgi:hypothetical protein
MECRRELFPLLGTITRIKVSNREAVLLQKSKLLKKIAASRVWN